MVNNRGALRLRSRRANGSRRASGGQRPHASPQRNGRVTDNCSTCLSTEPPVPAARASWHADRSPHCAAAWPAAAHLRLLVDAIFIERRHLRLQQLRLKRVALKLDPLVHELIGEAHDGKPGRGRTAVTPWARTAVTRDGARRANARRAGPSTAACPSFRGGRVARRGGTESAARWGVVAGEGCGEW